MGTLQNPAQTAEILNEVADLLSDKNWRGDLQEALRDTATTLSGDQSQVKQAAWYSGYSGSISPQRLALDPSGSELWALIDEYVRKASVIDFWSGQVKNSHLINPVYEVWYKLKDEFSILAGKVGDYGYGVHPVTADGRKLSDLLNDYGRKMVAADYLSGTVTDKAIIWPAYDAHFELKRALIELSKQAQPPVDVAMTM